MTLKALFPGGGVIAEPTLERPVTGMHVHVMPTHCANSAKRFSALRTSFGVNKADSVFFLSVTFTGIAVLITRACFTPSSSFGFLQKMQFFEKSLFQEKFLILFIT